VVHTYRFSHIRTNIIDPSSQTEHIINSSLETSSESSPAQYVHACCILFRINKQIKKVPSLDYSSCRSKSAFKLFRCTMLIFITAGIYLVSELSCFPFLHHINMFLYSESVTAQAEPIFLPLCPRNLRTSRKGETCYG
jgi:hypothetical protein